MYMGQQSWGQAGQQSWQQQAAAQAQQQGAAVMQQQQQRPAGADVGNAQRIRIAGCKHEVVGPIICGDYSIAGSNHGKPSYKKDVVANGLQVMMYFWDERDGAASSGWWIGPQVGGNMVWGHHPNRTTGTPPTSGWQAPHSAAADPAMTVSPITAAPANGQQQWRQQGQQQWAQQQQAQQNWKQNNWQQGGWQQGGNQQNWQQNNNQWNQRPQQQQWKDQAEENNRKRLEEQKARLEAQRGQQNEIQRKRMEEQQRRMEEMKRQQEEYNAVRTIRATIGKLRAVTADTFETIKSELAEVLAREFDSCGAQKSKIQEESDKALEAASARLEKIKEMDLKRKEAMENAQASLEQLIEMAEGVEAATKDFADGVANFTSLHVLDSEEKVSSAAAEVEDLGKDASEKVDVALEFIKAKGQEVRILIAAGGSKALLRPMASKKAATDETVEEEKDPEAAAKPTWIQLQHRVGTCKTSVDKDIKQLKAAVEAALKKAAAQDEWKKIHETFAKYDTDKDGLLNRKEISVYADSEFSFKLTDSNLDQIFKVMVCNGDAGVKESDLQRLKASIGIAREMVRDQTRRKEREEREAEIAKRKEKFQVNIDEVAAVIKAADSEIQEFTQLTRSLMTEGRTMKAVEMVAKAAEIDAVVETATAKLAEATKAQDDLSITEEEQEKELVQWFELEKKKLANLIKNSEGNLSKSNAILAKFREDAARKDVGEVKLLSTKVLNLLKAHQKEAQLSIVALFSTIDANDKGSIDRDSFVKYLSNIADEKAGEEKKNVLSEEELGRVFTTFDEEKEGLISQDTFKGIMRVMMKVLKDVAITETFSIKDTKTVRRLDVGEVIEVVDGPRKEEATDVTRVHARAMSDGAEGWVTTEGNHGTVFLKEGGNLFKVVKDTILTECFQIDASKEESRKVKESTRKLKAGEILELREWGRTQEDTGLTRMKCKVRSDGMVGFVTTVGNTGIKFVEAV